jgi:hypothetical protein
VVVPSAEPIQHVEAEFAFTRPQDVTTDTERPGLLRGPDVDVQRPDGHFDVRTATAQDCAALEGFTPDLMEHGFGHVDLSGRTKLQALLEQIRAAGHLEESQAAEIRRSLVGRSLPLHGGRRLKLLFVVPEGFIMRRAGPNGMQVHADDAVPGMNHHDGAINVHADQDVGGTPLRQMMRGAAPWLFHHESPDGRNARSPLFLLNVWIPLEQITRPLSLMDQRTLDRQRHQLRFGLKVDSFLSRGQDRSVNHVWSFLHDHAQDWYFTSELDANTAYVFETLSTPHASIMVPGEDLAEAHYLQLDDAMAAIDARDAAALSRAASRGRRAPGDDVTAPLRRAIAQMGALLDEAARHAAALCRGEDDAGWRARASRAQQRVVRKSIEMRAVGIVTRDIWPFTRW